MTAPVLVVAATSARMLAQSARRGGFRPIALDVFGDLDTRRAAHWVSIAKPRRQDIDAERMEAALTRLARLPGVVGWVAGGGLEDRLDVMGQCTQALPLIGNGAAAIAATKDPARFFGLLDQHGIEHPETRAAPPSHPAGWLSKRVGGTGGWHVRRLRARAAAVNDAAGRDAAGRDAAVRDAGAARGDYYQREVSGVPMSALFLSNGIDVSLVGFNRLLFGASGDRPFVFQGAVGPVALPKALEETVRQATAQIVRHIGLLGLNSMDFLLSDGRVSVLEVNPRPSATLELHDDRLDGGLMNAHLRACRARSLPRQEPARPMQVRGLQVVYARRPMLANRKGRARLQELGWCHDIGREGTHTGCGEPLCSVSARAQTEGAVIAQLAQRARHIEQIHEEENDG